MKKIISAASFITLALPSFAFAAGNDLQSLIYEAGQILNTLIPLLILATLVAFFWGLLKYVWGGGEEAHKEGRNIMMAGIAALFVMVSVWGIIRLVQNTLLGGGGDTGPITPPKVQGV